MSQAKRFNWVAMGSGHTASSLKLQLEQLASMGYATKVEKKVNGAFRIYGLVENKLNQ